MPRHAKTAYNRLTLAVAAAVVVVCRTLWWTCCYPCKPPQTLACSHWYYSSPQKTRCCCCAQLTTQRFACVEQAHIDETFKLVKQLRFKQEESFKDVRLTPYAAGHTLGGAVWRFQKETVRRSADCGRCAAVQTLHSTTFARVAGHWSTQEQVVYAVDLNDRRDAHLNGTDLLREDSFR